MKTIPVNCQSDMMFRDALNAVLVNVAREFVYTEDNVPTTGKGIFENVPIRKRIPCIQW